MSDLSKELRAQANQHPLDADLLMFDVAASQIETLQQERDQLAAGVERLRSAIGRFSAGVEPSTEYLDAVEASEDDFKILSDAYHESPAASLLLHDAGVLEEMAGRWEATGTGRQRALWFGARQTLREAASDLRKQAAEQESK